jgi:hypothetical protein
MYHCITSLGPVLIEISRAKNMLFDLGGKMVKSGQMNGVKIVDFKKSANIDLCSDCFEILLNQLGGWGNVDLSKVYPLNNNSYLIFCSICGKSIKEDRRRGVDRRFYDYAIHMPERRRIIRRKADAHTLT